MLPPAGQFWYYRRERVSGRRGTIVSGVSKTRRRFLSLLFVLNYIYFLNRVCVLRNGFYFPIHVPNWAVIFLVKFVDRIRITRKKKNCLTECSNI